MIRQLPNDELLAPAWLDGLCPPPVPATAPGTAVTPTAQDGLLRVSATLRHANAMNAEALEAAVADLYGELFDLILQAQHPKLLRIWNGLPGIVQRISVPEAKRAQWESMAPDHEPFDRYMAFNAGRSTAFNIRYGDERLAQCTPAATAVGHLGEHLQVHILASKEPGQAIENPRQVPAYTYSPRYGPSPPVFVRATRYGDRLFISGTASIVGEKSAHPDQLQAQFDETLANLNAITKSIGQPDEALRHFRIYAPHAQDLPHLAEELQRAYPCLSTIELMRSDICRRNLRVEIEAAT